MKSETNPPPAVAIVGAGISGLVCARQLRRSGVSVQLFDKARGPGGRMATRRTNRSREDAHSARGRPPQLQFDHGAQYFTVHHQEFAEEVAQWQREGLVEPWGGRLVALDPDGMRPVSNDGTRFVGTPRMSAVTRRLAAGVTLELERRITAIAPAPSAAGSGWMLREEAGNELGPFETVVFALPSPQALPFLAGGSLSLARSAEVVRYSPTWALMLAFEQPLDVPFDGAFVNDEPTFSWVARDASKPQRRSSGSSDTWVLHASPTWSQEHLEQTAEQVRAQLIRSFENLVRRVTNVDLPPISTSMAHRWRFAQPENPTNERCLWDPTAHLGACGDWCGGPRVEGAYLSGRDLARRICAARALTEPT